MLMRSDKLIFLKILYTACFSSLCIIDWMKSSLNGHIQMAATNVTGLVVAVLILSTCNIMDFMKSLFGIWTFLCLVIIPPITHYVLAYYPYKWQVYTAIANIVIYGYILIKFVRDIVVCKLRPKINYLFFIIWFVSLFLMLISINESIWPFWFLIVFGCYYLAKFDSTREELLNAALIDGLIVGFFLIQGMALLFRPYDIPRYRGFYINPNMNSLFYVMSYSAFLCKWNMLRKDKKNKCIRVITVIIAGSLYGFCLFTGSKTSILSLVLVTIPFVFISIRHSKSKLVAFFKYWIVLGGVAILSVPVVYLAIRYMPTIHLHPMYFEGDYNLQRVQPGEPRDSDKYVSFERAMEVSLGRFFYMLPESHSIFGLDLSIVSKAEELENVETTYIFTEEEYKSGIDPVRYRLEIYKYFVKRINIIGHGNIYEGAPVTEELVAPHAHNIFIQFAFLYGLPSGVAFCMMIIMLIPGCVYYLKQGKDECACLIICFAVAIVSFGLFEIDWMCGQLSFALLYLIYRNLIVIKPVKSNR